MTALTSLAPITRRTALGAIAALAIGCRESPAPSKKVGAQRVVSISPSTTEALFAIGAGELLVGRSRYCDTPKEVLNLPVVGGFSDPNLERILGLTPSLVIGARGPAGPSLDELLRARGIATFFPSTESLAEITAMITGLGALVARVDEARRVNEAILAKRRAVELAVAPRPKKRVLFLFDVAPIIAAGPGSFPDELLAIAGAENVIREGGSYPAVDMERVLKLAPELLLDGAGDASKPNDSRVLAQRDAPGFRDLDALKKGQVRFASSDAILRPGPRIGDGLVLLARAIHGDDLRIDL